MNIGAYYVILAVSWNLLAGFTGQFSLAQHAFAAVGAYGSGLLIYHLKTPLAVSIPAGVLAAALAGYLLGRLVLRMRTIYLSIATWAFAETFRIVLTAAYEFTRGDLGLSVPSLYGHVRPVTYYYTFVIVAALCVLATHVSRAAGRLFHACAVTTARTSGADTTVSCSPSQNERWRDAAALRALVLTLTPSIVDFSEMAKIIIIVVIGGLGHFIGPVLAAPPINFLSTYLQAYGEWSLVLFAAVVIVVMRSYPAGLAGLIEGQLRRWRAKP
jgi:branched-chain amino acid transport system permease protein